MLLSPTSDTRDLVVQAYEGHGTYSCAKCAAVIVSVFFAFMYMLSTNVLPCGVVVGVEMARDFGLEFNWDTEI